MRVTLFLLFQMYLGSVAFIAQGKSFYTFNKGYYYSINQAELAVADSAFFKADSIYQLAFQSSNRNFGQDYFLAGINATRLQSDSLVLGYLKSSVQCGVQYQQIKQHALLKGWEEQSDLTLSKSLLNYQKHRKTYLVSLDKKLKKQIKKLVFRDQMIRTIPGFFKLFAYSADARHFKKLLQICTTTGKLPGYSMIGEVLKHKNDLQDVGLLLRHFHHYELKVLEPYILRAIDEGEFNPWYYASALEYKTILNPEVMTITPDSITFKFSNTYGVLAPFFLGDAYASKNTSVVDSLRSKIGLEPIADQLKKKDKSPNDFANYPAYGLRTIHRKDLGKMWKKGKPWKKKSS